MTILITGATGRLGRLVLDSLLARGAEPQTLVAGARDVAKAADLAERGIRVVALDYNDPATVASALEGVDSVLLISGSEVGGRASQHQVVIDAAVAAGVDEVRVHERPEGHDHRPRARAGAQGDGGGDRGGGAARRDPAEQLVHRELRRRPGPRRRVGRRRRERRGGSRRLGEPRGLRGCRRRRAAREGHIGEVYELGGDVAWTFDDLASAIAEVTGRPVEYRALSSGEHAAALEAAGLDAGTVGFVTALDAGIRDGALADSDGTLARLLGRPTTPLVEGLRALV